MGSLNTKEVNFSWLQGGGNEFSNQERYMYLLLYLSRNRLVKRGNSYKQDMPIIKRRVARCLENNPSNQYKARLG